MYQPKGPTHGYVKNKSIVTNAERHSRRRYVLNLDLQDFFPTITFKRVRGLFKAVPYSRNEEISTWLAHICCWHRTLPQGAPTSPVISNMICAAMDSQLRRLAVEKRCVYTRYADDITFSTSMRQFPSTLARIEDTSGGRRLVIGEELAGLIKKNGFRINEKKSRLQTTNRRQEVTGLTVNRFPNVSRAFLNQLREMLFVWKKFGETAAAHTFETRWDGHSRSPVKKQPPDFRHVVKGKIEFVGMVRGKSDPTYIRLLGQLKELAPELVQSSTADINAVEAVQKLLRKVLDQRYSEAELRDLCRDLDIDHERLDRRTKMDFVAEIVGYMTRRDRILELAEKVKSDRPTPMQDVNLELLSRVLGQQKSRP